MKIAIVGSGISGLICAHLLCRKYDVTLFEAEGKVGGHVNTVTTFGKSGKFQIDTGFIVFNEKNYPNFVRLIHNLGVRSQPTRMGFSVRSEILGYEYSGETIVGLFGHPRNLTDLNHWGMVRDILRFHKLAKPGDHSEESVHEFISRTKLGRRFRENFLLPLGSALWSCPEERFETFPMEFVSDFLANHQMLQAQNRPVWRVITGGSNTYVEKIVETFAGKLFLNAPIRRVEREGNQVRMRLSDGTTSLFDEVILACHANQSLSLLKSPTAEEVALLQAFPYENNMVSLHSDDSHLPKRRTARASWNAYLSNKENENALITYDMNILQNLSTTEPFCVSLNQKNGIPDELHHADFQFSHPTYHSGRKRAQLGHKYFIRNRGISLCGAYWGYGFHEDGLVSGLRVCNAFGMKIE